MPSIYFTSDHDQFRDALRGFLAKEVDPIAWEKGKRIPPEIWTKMGNLGYLGICYPETWGGSDADIFYSAVFLEEISRMGLGGFSAAVGVQEYMATAHIAKFGSYHLKQGYLAPSIAGEKVGALAISEPDVGSDVANLQCRALREGDFYRVNGSKTFITNGVDGHFATVAVRTGEEGSAGVSLLVMDQGLPGFSSSRLDKMGWHCSDTGLLTFDNVMVPASHLIGKENMGFYYIMECFQLERLVAALTALGGAEACLEMTLKYIKQREAFGRPVARFQVIRHRLADLACELEAARQLTYHACWLYDQNIHAVKECSMAKLKATELGKIIADECLQCYGGYGFMEEYPIARMYRDARAGTIVGGTTEIMKEIIAKIMVDDVQYQAPSHAAQGTQSKEVLHSPDQIFASLPQRYTGPKDLAMIVHFDFQEDDHGAYTVKLQNGTCSVWKGLEDDAHCRVVSPGNLYRDIELGKISPEAAFMGGKIKVTDPPLMLQFMGAFKKLPKT